MELALGKLRTTQGLVAVSLAYLDCGDRHEFRFLWIGVHTRGPETTQGMLIERLGRRGRVGGTWTIDQDDTDRDKDAA